MKYLLAAIFAFSLSAHADHSDVNLTRLNGATFQLVGPNPRLNFSGVLIAQNTSPLYGSYVMSYTPTSSTGGRPLQYQLTLSKLEGRIKGLSGLCRFTDNSAPNETVCSYDLSAEGRTLVGHSFCNYYSYSVSISLR